MNFRKLITYLTMGTVAVMPFATAQNPTILQGNYISNVFGNSNFVLNPNAQTNTANVAVSSATVTRSTTTPLVATSEFNITTSTSTGYADWSLRAFDQGMKNNNCEARFTYRGFSVGSTTAQILQGANVVAQLTLTASTDPRIASINFPCGDLSAVTKFRLQQATASLTGTNEIGGIYIGLATNMANVAQAEQLGVTEYTGCTSAFSGPASSSFASYAANSSCTINNFGSATTSTKDLSITIPNAPAGKYLVVFNGLPYAVSNTNQSCYWTIKEDTSNYLSGSAYAITPSTGGTSISAGQLSAVIITNSTATRTWRVVAKNASAATGGVCNVDSTTIGGATAFSVYRFPSSSELVVTPERQNVWGGVVYTGSTNNTIHQSATAPTAFASFNNAGWNQPTYLKGRAQVTTTNSGNDLGFSIPNLPVGNYKVEISGLIGATQSGDTGITKTSCNFKIVETTTSTDVAKQSHQDWSSVASTSEESRDWPNTFHGVFNNTSVATRNFRLEAQKYEDTTTGKIGVCQAYTNASGLQTYISFLITPLDQPSNSALYVQGPVKAAETGAAIPEGYVNEFATRSISDTSLREQLTPAVNTFYYPWTSTLTLPLGNWMLCYKGLFQYKQTVSSGNVGFLQSHVQNQTDNTVVMQQTTLGQLLQTPYVLEYLWSPMSQCKPIAITSSKTFRIGIAYGNNSGTPTVNALTIRGDISTTELYAIRLN